MTQHADIPRLGFHPPDGYVLDIEVFRANDWLERVPEDHFRYPSRLDFHQLILVTQGRLGHTVDFQLESLRAGSLLAMRPGQVQCFEAPTPWDGWVVIFRPESVQLPTGVGSQPWGLSVDDLPVHLALGKASFEPVRAAMAQMHQDAKLTGAMQLVGVLERAQLQALLIRLQLASEQLQASPTIDSSLARHFRKFRQAVEQRFHEWHHISAYAKALGISEKTLSRATREATGLPAKAYLSKRIALEAKRMLAYTRWPIAQVADKLGFDEATNFIKFFRREAGFAPSEFRRHHRGA
ncbi:MAG: AraC family transcriptional regulator [Burkholderiaceae bacterium]|nr:AraC family transcriptional regulator [Rhodoferax sp.]MDO8770047.1 AraC family transcriptional regulator [Burkholderiaceae bacterium]